MASFTQRYNETGEHDKTDMYGLLRKAEDYLTNRFSAASTLLDDRLPLCRSDVYSLRAQIEGFRATIMAAREEINRDRDLAYIYFNETSRHVGVLDAQERVETLTAIRDREREVDAAANAQVTVDEVLGKLSPPAGNEVILRAAEQVLEDFLKSMGQ